MPSTELFLGIGILAAAIFGLLGCFSLHRRLRTRTSLGLLLSVLVLAGWLPFAGIVNHIIWGQIVRGVESQVHGPLLLFTEMVMPVLLLLSAAIHFWLAARSVVASPNQSFKPNPLRGSA